MSSISIATLIIVSAGTIINSCVAACTHIKVFKSCCCSSECMKDDEPMGNNSASMQQPLLDALNQQHLHS